MKSQSVGLLVLFLIGVCSTCALSAPPNKVVVCHQQKCPEGNVHGNLPITLEVNENALGAHIDHGDTLGVCEYGERYARDDDEGDDGDDGDDGQDGEDGDDGADGEDGEDGEDGQDGDDGVDGQDGQGGSQGPGGSSGSDGQDGVDGADGEDGSSCTVITVGNCVSIQCDDGADALICDGQDGASCTIEEFDDSVLVSCPDGTSVTVGNTNFDDDNDGTTNDIDQCPGTPQGFLVDEVGCMLVQKQPPPPNLNECDPGVDLFGGDQDGHFCGLCGSGCELSLAMLFIGLAFLRKRGI